MIQWVSKKKRKPKKADDSSVMTKPTKKNGMNITLWRIHCGIGTMFISCVCSGFFLRVVIFIRHDIAVYFFAIRFAWFWLQKINIHTLIFFLSSLSSFIQCFRLPELKEKKPTLENRCSDVREQNFARNETKKCVREIYFFYFYVACLIKRYGKRFHAITFSLYFACFLSFVFLLLDFYLYFTQMEDLTFSFSILFFCYQILCGDALLPWARLYWSFHLVCVGYAHSKWNLWVFFFFFLIVADYFLLSWSLFSLYLIST